jgi:hypothetical protein
MKLLISAWRILRSLVEDIKKRLDILQCEILSNAASVRCNYFYTGLQYT